MRRTPLTIGSLVLGLMLTACGGGSTGDAGAAYATTPAKQIEADALAALAKLTSVHLSGQFVDGGGSWTVDLDVAATGDCQGQVSSLEQGVMRLRQVDGVSYFKGDAAFWGTIAGTHASEERRLVKGRWVTNSTDPNGFGEFCDLGRYGKRIAKAYRRHPGKVIGTASIFGVTTVKLGQRHTTSQEVLQVQAEAPHNILRVDEANGRYYSFSRFDVPVTVDAPAKARVFDSATMGLTTQIV